MTSVQLTPRAKHSVPGRSRGVVDESEEGKPLK